MTFHSDIRHWPTLAALTDHLAAHPPVDTLWGSWVDAGGRRIAWKYGRPIGACLHHTWKPVPAQWVGRRSVEAQRTWFSAAKQWQAGPHLYVVSGSPNPANDGIYQLTPLNLPGIHAGAWNNRLIGVEVVGDYDSQPWPDSLRTLVIGAVVRLFRWLGIDRATLDTLRGHRECGSPKTCPGLAINLDAVRAQVQAELGWG